MWARFRFDIGEPCYFGSIRDFELVDPTRRNLKKADTGRGRAIPTTANSIGVSNDTRRRRCPRGRGKSAGAETNTGAVQLGAGAPDTGLRDPRGVVQIFNTTEYLCSSENIGWLFAFVEVNFPTRRAGLGRPRRLASFDHAADDRFRRRCQLHVSTSKWLGPIPFSSDSTHPGECLADSR